jgi:hypothetical protein
MRLPRLIFVLGVFGPCVFAQSIGSGRSFGPVPRHPGTSATEIASLSGAIMFGGSGLCLAVSGDTLVVGGTEIALVHERAAFDQWTLAATLAPGGSDPSTAFGCSVAIDGDTIAVGSALANGASGSADEGGAVYVFERDRGGAGAWGLSTRLEPSPARGYERFGAAVALLGDTLFVGAPGEGARGAGAVHVYQRSGSRWAEAQLLRSPDGVDARDFGRVLATDTGRLAVAGMRVTPRLEGRVALYEPSAGVWLLAAHLAAPGGSPAFGVSLALEDDRLAIGEPFEPLDPIRPGRVRIFQRDAAGGWTQASAFGAPGGQAGDGFGWSVALAGELLAAGAPQWTPDPSTLSTVGAFHLFEHRSGSWEHASGVPGTPTVNLSQGSWFGRSVLFQGSVLHVGTPAQSSIGGQDSGRVHVFALGLSRTRP